MAELKQALICLQLVLPAHSPPGRLCMLDIYLAYELKRHKEAWDKPTNVSRYWLVSCVDLVQQLAQ
jgi:hypothetical protein